MSIILFIVLPVCWALTGKLLGLSVAASCFYSAAGKRAGQSVSRWCVPGFPIVYLALMFAGMSGSAKDGVQLFGSPELFEFLGGLPIFALPALALFAGVLYVIRDLTLGHDVTSK